jgi:nitroreductase
MQFQQVVERRRMIRRYSGRSVPPDEVAAILDNALRGPSAGFSQGFAFLVLDRAEDITRFREAATPTEGDEDDWFAATFDAPLVVVPCSNKDAYLDRYAEPDKGFTDRSDAWWPAPYWDIDTGFATLLMLLTAVDRGLGACFFGIPIDRVEVVKEAFDIPLAYRPIGAVTVGYGADPPLDRSDRRKRHEEMIHRGRW